MAKVQYRKCTFCQGYGKVTHKTAIPGANVVKKHITEPCPVCDGTGQREIKETAQ